LYSVADALNIPKANRRLLIIMKEKKKGVIFFILFYPPLNPITIIPIPIPTNPNANPYATRSSTDVNPAMLLTSLFVFALLTNVATSGNRIRPIITEIAPYIIRVAFMVFFHLPFLNNV